MGHSGTSWACVGQNPYSFCLDSTFLNSIFKLQVWKLMLHRQAFLVLPCPCLAQRAGRSRPSWWRSWAHDSPRGAGSLLHSRRPSELCFSYFELHLCYLGLEGWLFKTYSIMVARQHPSYVRRQALVFLSKSVQSSGFFPFLQSSLTLHACSLLL